MKFALVCDAVVAPVSVMVTFAVAVVVPLGTYCTMIVQLSPATPGGAPPDMRTVPLAHVPPVMEKVPPAAPTLVTVGAAVRVIGPAFAFAGLPLFLTVIVPE